MSKIPINIKDLAIWPITTEETSSVAATYGTKIDFKNRFMSYTDTPKAQNGSLNGDGVKTNTYFGKDGGELTLNIQRLVADEKVALFGETKKSDSTVAMGKDDVIPYCAVAFKVENDDGSIDLYKYPKVKLVEQAQSVEQKSESGVKYSTMSLKGEYLFDLKNSEARYVKEDKNVTTDAAEITAWFENAAFSEYSAG